MTAARIVVRGATTAFSRRTVVRKAFLGCWHPLVDACWLYSLAYAQMRTGMAIHHGVRVITHHHLSVTPSEPNTSEFLRFFHSDVSGSLRNLLRLERYDVPDSIFDKRATHCMRLLDAEAQAAHLLYERLNPVAAGLVTQPDHMPGLTLDFLRWKNDALVIKRPPVYFSKNRPEELTLELTPPPLLYRDYGGDLEALVYDLETCTTRGAAALKRAHKGRSFLGAQKVRRLHPWSEPVSMAERPGRHAPSFKLGGGDWLDRDPNREARRENSRWQGSYGDAREKHHAQTLRRRERGSAEPWDEDEVVFPHGTYEMRVLHHVPVASPDPDALVSAPGPLLDEVQDELDHDRELRDGPSTLHARRELRSQMRLDCELEADPAAQHEHLSFGRPERKTSATTQLPDAPVDSTQRPEPVIRHRFDRSSNHGDAPRRVITLRDQRTGRPPKPTGADPPR